MSFSQHRPFGPVSTQTTVGAYERVLLGLITMQELASITDHTIFSDLRQADLRAGLWVSEDPPLAAIQLWLNNSRR